MLCLCLATSASAGSLWEGLLSFAKPDPAAPGMTVAPGQDWLCERAIQKAEARHGLPQGLLMQIGLAEAGHRGRIWPWTVNAEGDSRYFNSRAEAVQFVARKEAQGVARVDTGCLQVNRYWHREAFPDLASAFDPSLNADYAARYLHTLRAEFGTWDAAVGAYHSRDAKRSADYMARVAQTKQRAQALARQISGAPQTAGLPNFLPGLSADLAQVDVAQIVQSANAHAATASSTRHRRVRDSLPVPKPGQGHALFAAGGGALFPTKIAPLY